MLSLKVLDVTHLGRMRRSLVRYTTVYVDNYRQSTIENVVALIKDVFSASFLTAVVFFFLSDYVWGARPLSGVTDERALVYISMTDLSIEMGLN